MVVSLADRGVGRVIVCGEVARTLILGFLANSTLKNAIFRLKRRFLSQKMQFFLQKVIFGLFDVFSIF